MHTSPGFGDTILLLGAGRMGSALLRGWLAQGIPATSITVMDPKPDTALDGLAVDTGFRLNPAELDPVDVLVVAVKPQLAAAAAQDMHTRLGGHSLVVSIMAGKTLADLRWLFPAAGGFVRAMPNLAAAVGQGATALVADPSCCVEHAAQAARLLAAVGALEWLADETLMDAATAVSGSGPAYVFYLLECLARAGIEAGLPPESAERLARATIVGAGELLRKTDLPAAELRSNVTSPGGTTQAGLSVLMRDGQMEALVAATVAAAAARARDLSGSHLPAG